jgi:3-isopropylmalate/(R)-2-methylmalate dehydratase large subunit
MANMAAELGAVTGIFPFDNKLLNFCKNIPLQRKPRPVAAGEDAYYEMEGSLDLSTIIPLVAKPHQPNNVVPATELTDIIPDQIYIGSCTNSRIEDLRIVSCILKNKSVKIPTLISPGSINVQKQAEEEGLLKIFLEAGCNLIYPGCNACFGGPIGLLGKGMIGLSTTNRNFSGRMGGDHTTKVYLGSPATATASAISGRITSPEEI